MTDKLKLLMGLSALSIAASLYQLFTKTYHVGNTFLVIYCALIVIFNRDRAISKNKLAMVVVILTLVLQFLVTIFIR
ncbi:MAG: hypothetical protein L0I48_00200 [Lactococcus plantarum]|nr:hypothetical protein [Lactococcus plantarum]MDN6069589.1 hypothetical protein [Lactococcus plantarum]MDN6084436.1 hypothetical protein [Lactococcus plantarum]